MQDFQSTIPGLAGRIFGGGGSFRRLRPYGAPAAAQAPVKCPRCDSTNTKFCYYNNYNLSQPRHFCKSCRRYWTMGGVLRNVPVGGGCRKSSKRAAKKGQAASCTNKSANSATTSSSDGPASPASATALDNTQLAAPPAGALCDPCQAAADHHFIIPTAPPEVPASSLQILGRAAGSYTPFLSSTQAARAPAMGLHLGYVDDEASVQDLAAFGGRPPVDIEWVGASATSSDPPFFDISGAGQVATGQATASVPPYWNMGPWAPDVAGDSFYGLP